jgi:hypothetical protein
LTARAAITFVRGTDSGCFSHHIWTIQLQESGKILLQVAGTNRGTAPSSDEFLFYFAPAKYATLETERNEMISPHRTGTEAFATLEQQVYELLRADLMGGRFLPGEKLSLRKVAFPMA